MINDGKNENGKEIIQQKRDDDGEVDIMKC